MLRMLVVLVPGRRRGGGLRLHLFLGMGMG